MIDLSGLSFGRLTVVGANRARHRLRWNCVCECGAQSVVDGFDLRSGHSTSCGCYKTDRATKHTTKFDDPQMVKALRGVWRKMISRTTDPTDPDFVRWGGRGIQTCERWLYGNGSQTGLALFVEDMSPRPSPRHTLDRYPNNNGDYEPGNVRWATQKEQCRNRRNNRMIAIGNQMMTLADWCETAGLRYPLVHGRLRKGWSPEEALEFISRKPSSPSRRSR